MNLEFTLSMMASQLHIDADKLIAYANEDLKSGLGGYHYNNALSKWAVGGVFEVEGATLYALVRYFKPQKVVEVGGLWGCSTAHLATALKANGGGMVYSVDNGALGAEHGSAIPSDLRDYVTLIASDGEDYLRTLDDQSVGLVFSDADHATETTRRIAVAAIPKLIDGGLFIEHDASHDFAIDGNGNRSKVFEGEAIRKGLDAAGLDYRVYLTEPSDCGIAVAQIKHDSAAIPETLKAGLIDKGEDFGKQTLPAEPARKKPARRPKKKQL